MASQHPARALPPAGPAPHDAPYPSAIPLGWATRRRVALAGIGAAAYLLWLLATLPAGLVVDRSARVMAVGGTAWRGEALLAGGQLLRWRWAPLATLANFALAADFTVTGTATELGGRALLRRHSVRLDDVAGTADLALLDALAPALPFTCDGTATVDIRQTELGGADQRITGRAATDGGSCRARSAGVATPVPALVLEAATLGRASSGTVAPAGQRRRALVSFRLGADGGLSLAVTRDGAGLLPFAAPPAGLALDTRL